MIRLAVTLLGGFAVAVEGQPVTRFESDRVRALLAYLALPPGRAHSRTHLADLLWPSQPADAARANLRNTLSRLRHALDDHDPGRPLILADQHTVALTAGPEVVCDAAHFVALADTCAAHEHWQLETCRTCAPRLREAAELYQGALLGELSLSHSRTSKSGCWPAGRVWSSRRWSSSGPSPGPPRPAATPLNSSCSHVASWRSSHGANRPIVS